MTPAIVILPPDNTFFQTHLHIFMSLQSLEAVRGLSKKFVDTILNSKKWIDRFKIQSYLQRETSS